MNSGKQIRPKKTPPENPLPAALGHGAPTRKPTGKSVSYAVGILFLGCSSTSICLVPSMAVRAAADARREETVFNIDPREGTVGGYHSFDNSQRFPQKT